MAQYIDKSALVAEINQRIEDYKSHKIDDSYHDGLIFALEDLRDDFLDTLEVKEVDLEKDMQDALRMEYEKGRADVIADTLSWLENCWSKYCYNHTIIDAYKEGVVKD